MKLTFTSHYSAFGLRNISTWIDNIPALINMDQVTVHVYLPESESSHRTEVPFICTIFVPTMCDVYHLATVTW